MSTEEPVQVTNEGGEETSRGRGGRGGRGGNRGGRGGARGGGRGGYRNDDGENKGQENYEKKERGEGGQGQGRGRQRREPKYTIKKEDVTLDTEVPVIPKKGERIPEPNDNEYHKSLDDVQQQIEDIHAKLRKYIDEMRKNIAKNKDKSDTYPLKDLLKEKQDEKQIILKQYIEHRDNFQKLKEQQEREYDQAQKLRQKMKKLLSTDQIKSELAELRKMQSSGHIKNLAEEKQIINEISQLEKSLPHALPLEQITKNIETIKIEKNKAFDLQKQFRDQLDKLKKEIEEYQNDLTTKKNEKDESVKSMEPIIQSKRDEYYTKIDELKEKKREISRKYREQQDKYYEEQELLKHVDWLNKQKNRLKRDQEWKKKQEEYKQKDEERKAEQDKFNPYQSQIEFCNLLIEYCQKLNPSTKKVDEAQTDKNPNFDAEKVLKSDEWKKDKCEALPNKKDLDSDFFTGKPKKGKNAKQNKQKVENNEGQNLKLNHQIEILNFFEDLKIPPPIFSTQIEATVKSLNEKLQYFEGYKPGDKKTEEEEEKKTENTETKKENTGSKNKAKKTFEMAEDDFPTM